jgi:hypothetical protein
MGMDGWMDRQNTTQSSFQSENGYDKGSDIQNVLSYFFGFILLSYVSKHDHHYFIKILWNKISILNLYPMLMVKVLWLFISFTLQNSY